MGAGDQATSLITIHRSVARTNSPAMHHASPGCRARHLETVLFVTTILFISSLFLVSNLVVDLIYAYLDPRIHYG